MVAGSFSVLFSSPNGVNHKRNEENEIEQYSDEVITLRNFLATSMSMDIKKIIYDSGINSFIMGDILMSLADARNRYDYSCSEMANA